jgi:uncharacterized protein YbaA (DUF1428 family)
MTYVMAYAGSVPNDRKDDYLHHSKTVAEVFKEYGATRVVECWGDAVPPGELTSFPLAVKAEEGETVVIGWQEWPDKATQEANMPKAMSDPRLGGFTDIPIDGKRMIFAGFEVLLDV